ncbi:MAG: hypothetical protein DDT22_01362 [candidate division WS2 bacterium]|nr:hypothetical protein [Candidatus Lithacetigena glycinireducens]
MRKENIHQGYAFVTLTPNIAHADSVIATLLVPAGRVFRMQDATPLVLKLVRSDGVEISRASEIFLAWQPPVGKTIYQAGRTMNYGIFRRIPITEQENINTQARRLIEFDDEEIARAQRGEASLITGLTSDHRVLLMLRSPDVVDWANPASEFNFDMIVLTEGEFLAEKGVEEQ